jgi:hypothetical protein
MKSPNQSQGEKKMASTALGGNLPTGDQNGLNALAAAMISEPNRLRALLVLVDTSKVTRRTDDGEIIATARVRRIEAILPEDFGAAERLIRRSLEKRTGATVLPLELEDELNAAFAAVDLTADPDAPEAAEATPAEPGAEHLEHGPQAPAEPLEPPAEPPKPKRRGRKPKAESPEPLEPEPEPDPAASADDAEFWAEFDGNGDPGETD